MLNRKNFGDLEIAAGQKNRERDYWLQKLSGEWGKCTFPYETGKNGEQDYQTEQLTFQLPPELSSQLINISNESHARLYMILAAGLVVLLNKYTGSRDIIIGAPIFKQDKEGDFINTVLPIRSQLPDHMTFRELIIAVTHTFLEASEHQNYPVETLLYHLGMPFTGKDFPLFAVAILLENIHFKKYLQHLNLEVLVSFQKTGKSLGGVVEYNSGLYRRAAIEKMIGHFIQIYQQALIDVNVPLSDMQLPTEEEREQILLEFNATEAPYPGNKTIHELFEEQVEQRPNQVALVGPKSQIPNPKSQTNKVPFGQINACGGDISITYRELNNQADRMAHILKAKGVTADTIVAIMVERSIETIIGIMGILKSGGAYLPIDPDYPEERINYMPEDSKVNILVKNSNKFSISSQGQEKKERFKEIEIVNCQREIVYPAQSKSPLERGASSPSLKKFGGGGVCLNPQPATRSPQLAYIIYTSGSTGRPRGVMIRHESVINLVFCQIRRFKADSRDRVLQFSSICFDASVEQIFTAFFSGAALVLIEKTILPDHVQFRQYISRHMVTHIHAVPSFLERIDMKESIIYPLNLKRVVAGGDVCSLHLAKKWCRLCDFYNEYGPTETTVTSIEMLIHRVEPSWTRLPIGTPVDNTIAYILDRDKKLVPIGVQGELYIGGHGLARGYLNNPELTAEKFDHDLWDYQDYHDKKKVNHNKKFLRGGPGGAVFSKSAPLAAGGKKSTKPVTWPAGCRMEILNSWAGSITR